MVKYDNFLSSLTEYYGEHQNKTVMTLTKQYVQKKFKENQLPELKGAILLSHPSSWGFPDIAVIEKAYSQYKKDKVQIDKNVSYPEFKEDLSISDDEWKKGFSGLEALKKAVHSEEAKQSVKNTHIPKCSDCKFKPVQIDTGFEEHDECIDCGQYHSNFKQVIPND